ncbi:hypothetical protein SAMD00023353_6300440 [Rosellinia necatrix]|uniref:Tetratricopeptide repeat protein n=1 Tax=Rosellinia necatrix TaxID=77044 RepID=A0A1W2TSB2_ROSNE|nr:hypothetical protein SAMD00023353_6300440 [Rosellinia necatrix]
MASFDTSAFDLTPEEKHVATGEIKSLLVRATAVLARAKAHRSTPDFAEALALADEALRIALDPDACDQSAAPLATCHLYRGHALRGLRRYAGAREAYEAAAAAEPRTLTDGPAVAEAAVRQLQVQGREDMPEAPGPRGTSSSNSGNRGGLDLRGLSRFDTEAGGDAYRPTVTRPGPARRVTRVDPGEQKKGGT